MIETLHQCRSCQLWQPLTAYSFRADRQRHRTSCRACLNARPRRPRPPLTHKCCTVCHELKPAAQFYYIARQQRYRSACRPCAAAQVRECRQANRPRYLAQERARNARRRTAKGATG